MSERSAPWAKPGPETYFPSIGRTKHMEIVSRLKSDYGMGHGHANALVGWTLAGNVARA